MGPPNLLNLSVLSRTVTSIFGFFERVLAKAKPPTPAPAIRTFRGFSSEIPSTYLSVSVGLIEATSKEEVGEENLLLILGLLVIVVFSGVQHGMRGDCTESVMESMLE